MHLATAARRALAVTAATSLLTTGGFALSGSAFAAAGTVTGVTPSTTNNSGNTAVTVAGTGFYAGPVGPNGNAPQPDAIIFKLAGSNPPVTLTLSQSDTQKQNNTASSYSGTLGTSNAAPGKYDVYANNASGAGTVCPLCFEIGSSGAPDLTNITAGADTRPLVGGTRRQEHALDLFGRNLAKASTIRVLGANGVEDTSFKFIVNDPNNSSGYINSGLIRGYVQYPAGDFTSGKHFLSVTNTATPAETGTAGEVWFPKFLPSGISPNVIGVGATSKLLTITGSGIRQGSRVDIEDLSDPTDPTVNHPDISTGAATVSADGTSITVPVTVDPDAVTNTLRDVRVTGPDGGTLLQADSFRVSPPPSISGNPFSLGQGGTKDVTFSGTGFAAGATSATAPTFSVSGTGVAAQTVSSTNVQAVVRFTAATDATLGARTITVTNPDGGTKTYSGSATADALTINAGPTITSLTPSSGAVNQSKTITITGTNFDVPSPANGQAKPTVVFTLQPAPGQPRTADSNLSVGTVTSTAASGSTPAKLTFTLSVNGNAAPGLRDVIVTNSTDSGRAICSGCFGIDSLTAAPASGANSGTKLITFTGSGIAAGSTVRLIKAGIPGVQPDIAGSAVAVGTDGNSIAATFDLTDAATGPYNGVVTLPNGTTKSCSGCFTVTGLTPTVGTITPSSGGQGTVNRPISITGTNFSRGMQVAITGASVHDVVFVSKTQITGQVDIPSDTATGAKDVKVSNNDGSLSATKTGGFTVVAAPTVDSITPASYGQGAKAVKVTIEGADFTAGTPSSTVDLGPGITVTSATVTKGNGLPGLLGTADSISATINIAEAADLSPRDVKVINPDGGTGVLAAAFTVKAGPKVTGITPQALAPGATDKDITITGSGFSTTSGKTAVPTIQDVTLSDIAVSTDGTKISATATIGNGVTKGARSVVVTNPTDSGVGTCVGCFTIATAPGAPTNLVAKPADTSINVSWSAPADQGGSSITNYLLSAKGPDGKSAGTPATVGGGVRTATVTGLVVNTTYTLSLVARNAAGDSTPATISSRTTSSKASILTSSHSPSLTTTGETKTLSGRLLQQSTGQGIAGATIEIALVPDIGSATFPKRTTDSAGRWSYTFRPTYSHTIKTLFRGDATHAAVQAASYRTGVSPRLVVSTPFNGSTTRSGTPLVVRGSISPNKAGSLISLNRWNGRAYVPVVNTRVASNGTYSFSYNFGRGSYTLKVGIGRTSGNFVGYSPAFGIHRT